MKNSTALQVAQAIDLFHITGRNTYTQSELAVASGVSMPTINRNSKVIEMIDTALHINRGHYGS